jgi:predicted outer membrane repeat protein
MPAHNRSTLRSSQGLAPRSGFSSRRGLTRTAATVASTGLVVGISAVGVMPAFAAIARDCTEANTLTAPADNASDVQALLDDGTISIVCLSGTFGLVADTPLSYSRGVTLFGLPGATLDGQSQTRILEGGTDATLSVHNLTFINGAALDENTGGAILARGDVVVEDSRFINNSAPEEGGAIALGGGLPYSIVIERSTFVGNSAGTLGGAIYTNARDGVSITSSTFSNNTAADGGAVYYTGSVNIINSTFVGNRATGTTGEGGAILARGGTVSFSTFLNNTASAPIDGEDIPGEAIYLVAEEDSADLTLTANIFAGIGNHPQLGVGTLPPEPENLGEAVDGGANVFSTASEPDLSALGGTSVFSASVTQIFGASPQLGDNGGSTQTVALVSGSPAIGIVPADAPALTADQRGQLREGARDAGSFEFQPSDAPAPAPAPAPTLADTGSAPVSGVLAGIAALTLGLGAALLTVSRRRVR